MGPLFISTLVELVIPPLYSFIHLNNKEILLYECTLYSTQKLALLASRFTFFLRAAWVRLLSFYYLSCTTFVLPWAAVRGCAHSRMMDKKYLFLVLAHIQYIHIVVVLSSYYYISNILECTQNNNAFKTDLYMEKASTSDLSSLPR